VGARAHPPREATLPADTNRLCRRPRRKLHASAAIHRKALVQRQQQTAAREADSFVSSVIRSGPESGRRATHCGDYRIPSLDALRAASVTCQGAWSMEHGNSQRSSSPSERRPRRGGHGQGAVVYSVTEHKCQVAFGTLGEIVFVVG
jgi:hypothetical protein